VLYTEYLGCEIKRKRGRQVKGIEIYLQLRAPPKSCLRGINTCEWRRNPFGSLKRIEKASKALMSLMENVEMQVAALKPYNSLIVAEKYNVLWVLNIARRGGFGTDQKLNNTNFLIGLYSLLWLSRYI
jgi:hypothetical protein